MRFLVPLFTVLFSIAAALSLASGFLVTASLLIQDRAPRSTEFLGVSVFVSGSFLALGALLVGVEAQILGIARLAAKAEGDVAVALRTRVRRLLFGLVAAGTDLCCVLALAAYAILARIDQGFAVFG